MFGHVVNSDQGPLHTSMHAPGQVISLTSEKFSDLEFDEVEKGVPTDLRHGAGRGPRLLGGLAGLLTGLQIISSILPP
jgi:hypothetical protein